MPAVWEEIAARKQSQLRSRIPKEWRLSPDLLSPPLSSHSLLSIPSRAVPSILTPKELSLTSCNDATSLAQCIRERKFTAEEVTIAYCKRAAIAQQVCYCLTEIFFEEGMERARWLDRELRRTGKVIGPLHGVPVSVKDTFKIKGYDSSIGLAALVGKPAKENSLLVDILLEAGAVFYCKTNIPQTLMAFDSHNNIFDRVLNPLNPSLSAGGSSGGEGALVAMHGSPLGIGTDIGGSIRVPAMCNGLYGIKPSAGRVPLIGQEVGRSPGTDKVSIAASAGPIASSLRDCELLLKTVADSQPWDRDPSIHYGPWEQQGGFPTTCADENRNGKLVIGILRTDGIVTPLPPITKLIFETAKMLENAGHTVTDISSPNIKKCQSLANKFFGVDGNNEMLDLIESTGEPLSPWMSTRLARRPEKHIKEITELHAERAALATELLGMWKTRDGRRVDAIICPVAPHPVPPIDGWNGSGYTSMWVLLDCPTGTMPVREFREADVDGEIEGQALGSWDKVNRDLWDKSKIDRRIYLGSPLCIQVVAPRLQEYRLFRAMEIIDRVLHSGNFDPKAAPAKL